MTVKLVQEMTQMARKLRQPKHTFQLRHRPWQIQPFLIAPVLPGETLKNIVMQSRVVVDPIKNPLVGWWIEYYFFYVKHRDLPGRADYTDMMVNMDKSMAAYNSATVAEYYENASGGLGWVGPCLQRITEEFFREKGEAWNNANIGNLPTAKVDQGENWMDSLTPDASVATRDLDTETGDVLTAETFDRQYKVWEFMRQNSMTNMSYEDYLRTYGVKIADRDEPYKPELLRVIREWQYPVNTVEPTTGVPSAAVSWAVRERIDKDRFFKEPGFIFAVSVARPKVYYTKQKGHASQMLVDAFSWLPALMADDPATSLREVANNAGPLAGNITANYWVDVRDLFLYGDQFANFDLDAAAADGSVVDLPTTGALRKYASATDADALFKAASPANQIRQDGVCQLHILGMQTDNT